MPINWTDNKVINPNAQQRMNYTPKPPMTITPPQTGMQGMMDDQKMNMNMQPEMMMNQEAQNMMPGRMMNQETPNMNARIMNESMKMNDAMNNMMFQEGPPPVMDKNYMAGYLATQIGKNVRAEFPLPAGFYIDKAGILREVGVNYFVLEDYISHAKVVCDLYSARFFTIL